MSYAIKNSGPEASELIAFRIGDQEFCVNIMAVREIRGWSPVTPLPQSPDYVMGVINLRGVVLPIVNLAARLRMKPIEPDIRHVIIVAQVRSKVVGLLVEAGHQRRGVRGDRAVRRQLLVEGRRRGEDAVRRDDPGV